MKNNLKVILCFMWFLFHAIDISIADYPCERNEIYVDDKYAPLCEKTCANPTLQCIQHIGFGWKGCRCKYGYSRNHRGDCVKYNECNSHCGSNEIYFNELHGKKCEATCRVRYGTCDVVSSHGCYCKNNYFRNARNICVLERECEADYFPPYPGATRPPYPELSTVTDPPGPVTVTPT